MHNQNSATAFLLGQSGILVIPYFHGYIHFNPLALELDIYSLAHHLCKV